MYNIYKYKNIMMDDITSITGICPTEYTEFWYFACSPFCFSPVVDSCQVQALPCWGQSMHMPRPKPRPNPRQAQNLGPKLGPILIGDMSLGPFG